ncbi:MAG TPA: hypothetical protein VJ924_11930 [Alphaproteobacteria bacterium]|nr:hypothetical protein [Alphaproteobacteria bacterium]
MKFKAPRNVTAVAVGGHNYVVIRGMIEAPDEHAPRLLDAGFLPMERSPTHQPPAARLPARS